MIGEEVFVSTFEEKEYFIEYNFIEGINSIFVCVLLLLVCGDWRSLGSKMYFSNNSYKSVELCFNDNS